MNSLQLHGQDLYNDGVQNKPNHQTFFDDPMKEEQGGGCGGEGNKEIWMDQRNDHQEEDLIDVNDPIFYTDFPPLPDFTCMSSSSSSSSSSTPAPAQANTPSSSSSYSSASSSAASWGVLKSEAEEDPERRHYLDHQGRYNFNNNVNENKHGYYDDNCQNDHVHHFSTVPLSSSASMEIPPSDHYHQEHGIEGGVCMDVMESFGFMDLLENNDFFDPSSIFHPEEDTTLLEELNCQQIQEVDNNPSDQTRQQQQQEQVGFPPLSEESILKEMKIEGNHSTASDDLAMVFLDWLRNNKETVSAEDLRKVKIKKSTIECAANRLGGGKEAMKQLLKLILEWVQTNHLQKRRMLMMTTSLPSTTNCNDPTSTSTPLPNYQYQPDPSLLQNPNPSLVTPTTLNCASITQPDQPCLPWITPSQSFVSADPVTLPPSFPPLGGYMGDPFGNGSTCSVGGMANYTMNPVDYQMLGSSQAQWTPTSGFSFSPTYASFGENNLHVGPLTQPPNPGPAYAGFGNQCPYPQPYLQGQGGVGDSGLVNLGSSATKEARKKRMARQRRFLSHHRNHHSSHQNHNNPNQTLEAHARLGNDNVIGTPSEGQANPGNWMYWPPVGAPEANAAPPAIPGEVATDRAGIQGQNFQWQVAFDKRQGWKPEKNLKFLLQKVLKQSDVGNLGRIVLPKKEAETHLPELEARDGISIAMEDIGTSRVWNMRYRFWPNNKSRMYLLENTGDFVRTNGLQEGDFIVIYSDIKCGKYLIRGVKVRQQQQPQQGQKLESKRVGKSQRNGHANSPGPVDHNGIGSSMAIN